MNPKTKAGARFGAYHRVSQANGRDVGEESTMTDKEAWAKIDGWAASSGVVIADRYLDWDRTGSKLERPELERLIADLDAGVIDGIAVAKTDRLSRAKVSQALKLIGEIQERHPNSLALLDLGVDPTTPTGELMLTLLLAIAHMQWRQFKDTWAEAQKRAIDRGVWIGRLPFGYRPSVVGRTKKGKPINGPLEPDENAPIVTEAFRIAAVEGMHATMRYLEQMAPDKRWRTDETRRLLGSRAYLGEIRMGNLENRNAHEPLTDEATWTAAQTEPRARRAWGNYPLSGIVRCDTCGGSIVGKFQTVRGYNYRRMRCSNRACPGKADIGADALEEYLRGVLAANLARKQVRDLFYPGGVEEAREELERVRARRTAYVTKMDPEHEDFAAGLRVHDEAVREAQEEYESRHGQTVRAEVLPPASELSDPEQFERALRVVAERVEIRIRPGRGTIHDRVLFVPRVLDDEVVARALAA